MRMLRWMCVVTRKDKIRNEHIRGTTRVAKASKKITERRLIWYGHVMRRDGEHILRKVMRADIPGKRKRGRPKTRWKDACQRYLKSTGLRAGEETVRAMRRRKISSHRRPYIMGEARGKVYCCTYWNVRETHARHENEFGRSKRDEKVQSYVRSSSRQQSANTTGSVVNLNVLICYYCEDTHLRF